MTQPQNTIEIRQVPHLPARPADAHKGTFGKVLVVAGSVGMSGAAVLAGSAALRGGAGLVQLAVAEPIVPIVAANQPCYMTAPLPADAEGRVALPALGVLAQLVQSASAIVAGPGLGRSDDVSAVVDELLAAEVPLVLDADALNSLAGRVDVLTRRKGPLVLTPHPGEFARLDGCDTAAVQANRQERAVAFARRRQGVVLVLKGAGTIVTDGRRVYTNTTGNPGMATGGSGDVLAGLLGALLAGRALEPFDAVVLGVYLHGLAGDLARDERGETSLIATDLLDYLPAAFRRHGAKGGK
jgi:NAD(P)H-hydrate epimerase